MYTVLLCLVSNSDNYQSADQNLILQNLIKTGTIFKESSYFWKVRKFGWSEVKHLYYHTYHVSS